MFSRAILPAVLFGAILIAPTGGSSRFTPPGAGCVARADDPNNMLRFHARTRLQVEPNSAIYRVREAETAWNPHKTAIIICDMWDRHTCRGAERREAELAPKMNQAVAAARKRGVLIVHAPSSCMDYYKETPQRRRART